MTPLEPVFIPGLIRPLRTAGAYGGVNAGLTGAHAQGLLIEIPAYPNMQVDDWIKVYWGDDKLPVTSGGVLAAQLGKAVPMLVRADRVPQGLHSLRYTLERAAGGNPGEGTPVDILVRTELPGGIDPEPDRPGHQGMPPAQIEMPDSGIIDAEAAKRGVRVTLMAYPNMRQYDRISLSWGGVEQVYEVTAADVSAGRARLLVTEQTILQAGDGDALAVVYEVVDEVHNRSSDGSLRASVAVAVGEGLLAAPVIQNPDADADPADVIEPDKLGDASLTVSVLAISSGELQKGDKVTLTWTGITAQGEQLTVSPDSRSVASFPTILNFPIANAHLSGLPGGRGTAFYAVTRDGSAAGVSSRAFVSFSGGGRGLPRPSVSDNVDGTLDPVLRDTTVTVPGEALALNDHVTLTWLGTRADASVLLHTVGRPVSSRGVGKPMNFSIDGPAHIAALEGGSVSIGYRLYKYGLDRELTSDSALLNVGQARPALPAPVSIPAADGGAIQPEDLPGGELEIIVAPYPGMRPGQTVRLVWKASLGPAYDDWLEVTPPLEGRMVRFFMDRGTLEQYRNATVELFCQVEEPGAPTLISEALTFIVGARPVALPTPLLPQALEGVLDPAAASAGAIVRIPVEAGLAHGDEVEVSWVGDQAGGVATVNDFIHPDDVGKPFDLVIDHPYVLASNDGNVRVSYQVFRSADGTAPVSDPVSLRVQGTVLPPPRLSQAQGGELNPDAVLQGATVVIDAPAQLKEGDQVLLRVKSPASGGSTTVLHEVRREDAGKPLELAIDHRFINASNGVSIELEYDITRAAGWPVETSEATRCLIQRKVGDGPLLVLGARCNLTTYRASGAPRMITAVHATTRELMLAEWQYEGDTTWTAAIRWFDSRPELPLYARTLSQTYRMNPSNVVGNGVDAVAEGAAAFCVMRDEVTVGSVKEADLRAWGSKDYGGFLDANLVTVKNVRELSATSNAFAARLRDGNVLCWGGGMKAPAQNGDFTMVRSNALAFAGLKRDGSLFVWGSDTHGVPVPQAVGQYQDYRLVCGAAMAFAAVRENGQVKVWGDEANGGKLLDGQDIFDGVRQIIGNHGAFAALRDNGGSRTVFAWGNAASGGVIEDEEIAAADNVKALGAATAQAFTLLLETGAVRGWGAESHGGVIPDEIRLRVDIVSVVSTWHAFCALLGNGHVVAWGNEEHGGLVPQEIAALSDIVQVVGSAWSFAALRRDGTVVVWGSPVTGGDISEIVPQLVRVVAVYANSHGFIALRSDGRMLTWGQPEGGGNSEAVQGSLHYKLTHGRYISADGER